MNAREKRARKIKWTSEMKEYVQKHYPTEDTRAMAEKLGVTSPAVISMARCIGITKDKRRKPKHMEWTQEKEQYLKEHYATDATIKIAKKLGCTEAKIKWEAQKMGLEKIKIRATGAMQEKEVVFGNPMRIGKNQSEVSRATWTLVCSCTIDGYTPEQIATMTERSVKQVEEVLKLCKENGYLEQIKVTRVESLAMHCDCSVGRNCSGFRNAGIE